MTSIRKYSRVKSLKKRKSVHLTLLLPGCEASLNVNMKLAKILLYKGETDSYRKLVANTVTQGCGEGYTSEEMCQPIIKTS